MGYYLWSKPPNKPSFHTRSKQKASLATVGSSPAAPGPGVRHAGQSQAGRSDPRFQEAARPGNPDSPCDSASVPHSEEPHKERPSLKSINKVSQGFSQARPVPRPGFKSLSVIDRWS